jgi:hypothetical protein
LTSLKKKEKKMSKKTVDMRKICPFTLEPSQSCSTFKTGSVKKICPFSLEPCLHLMGGCKFR